MFFLQPEVSDTKSQEENKPLTSSTSDVKTAQCKLIETKQCEEVYLDSHRILGEENVPDTYSKEEGDGFDTSQVQMKEQEGCLENEDMGGQHQHVGKREDTSKQGHETFKLQMKTRMNEIREVLPYNLKRAKADISSQQESKEVA